MEPDRVWNLVTNPAWRPITDADAPGYIGLLTIAAFLVGLTIWTYTGASASTPKRVGILIGLRLLALLLAVLLALRPSASITEIPKLPSTLILVVDASESMSIKDEASFTRWEVVQRTLEKCGPLLDQMRDDQQTTVYVYHFSKDFVPDRDKYGEDVRAEGKRTDFGTMLAKLYDRHQGERLLRGLILVSDGRDNGAGRPAQTEIMRWRGLGCPVYTFAVGQSGTLPQEKDISFTSINPDPSPVAIKSELKVKAKLNAQGFQPTRVRVRLKIEGLPDQVQEFELTKDTDNDIEMTTKAPDKPGEVKVTMELVDPPQNQVTDQNDRIETYLTVTKEGVRVLIVSKLGPELSSIRRALATDKRFDFVEVIRAGEAPGTPEEEKAYEIEAQRYDVIILGDVSPKMLTSVRPTILAEIKKMVTQKGVGLMMTGGAYSLGGTAGVPGSTGWNNTPIADILPVRLPSDPVNQKELDDQLVSMEPTEEGLRHYLLRLNAEGKKNREAWALLNARDVQFQGYNLLGEPKPNAEILARVGNALTGPPLLVRHDAGPNARVLVFGASNTWSWTRPGPDKESRRTTADLHTRFWKQTVLWLAHQDELDGNVYVRPEFRRLVANGRQSIRMGMRDKRGDEVPEADFRYQVIGPGEKEDESKAKRADRDPKGGAKVGFEAKVPAEYRVVAWGKGKDPSGGEISDRAEARYVVFPEVSDEMLQPAANPDFLLLLENTANGSALDVARRADRLPAFLEEMKANPPKMAGPKPKPYPEWRRDKQKWFLPAMLILFVAILGLEWGLRRTWGMI